MLLVNAAGVVRVGELHDVARLATQPCSRVTGIPRRFRSRDRSPAATRRAGRWPTHRSTSTRRRDRSRTSSRSRRSRSYEDQTSCAGDFEQWSTTWNCDWCETKCRTDAPASGHGPPLNRSETSGSDQPRLSRVGLTERCVYAAICQRAVELGGSEQTGLARARGQAYLTAEYAFSFVQWCWASIMRIVPDFERMTRLCVPAPSPQ